MHCSMPALSCNHVFAVESPFVPDKVQHHVLDVSCLCICPHSTAPSDVQARSRLTQIVVWLPAFYRYDFDIPILAMDLVAAGGAVTLAIIDVCPVTPRLTLPQHYTQTMMELQHEFLPGGWTINGFFEVAPELGSGGCWEDCPMGQYVCLCTHSSCRTTDRDNLLPRFTRAAWSCGFIGPWDAQCALKVTCACSNPCRVAVDV